MFGPPNWGRNINPQVNQVPMISDGESCSTNHTYKPHVRDGRPQWQWVHSKGRRDEFSALPQQSKTRLSVIIVMVIKIFLILPDMTEHDANMTLSKTMQKM